MHRTEVNAMMRGKGPTIGHANPPPPPPPSLLVGYSDHGWLGVSQVKRDVMPCCCCLFFSFIDYSRFFFSFFLKKIFVAGSIT